MVLSQILEQSIRKDKDFNIKNAVAINIENVGSVNATFHGRLIIAGQPPTNLLFGGTMSETEDIKIVFDENSAGYNDISKQHLHIITTRASKNCSCSCGK